MRKHAEIIFDIHCLVLFLIVDAHVSQIVHVLVLCPGEELLHEWVHMGQFPQDGENVCLTSFFLKVEGWCG